MKNIIKWILFVAILFLASCKNSTKNISSKNTQIKDTVSTITLPKIKTDTLIKTSKPFIINGIKCNWRHFFPHDGETTLELRDYKTKRILLSYSDFFKVENDFNSSDYFNEHFQDLNFDGFKDFFITSYGSNEMTNLVNIYFFDKEKKSFIFSENLSDNQIEEIDNTNKKLVTRSSTIDNEIIKNHYFDKRGKIKYSEIITKSDSIINDTISVYKNRYKKIIGDKVIKTKVYITTE